MTEPVKKDEHFTLIKKDDRYDKLEKFLSPSIEDRAHSMTEGVISSIPGFGGILAKFFSNTIESPLQKRKRDFLLLVAMKLDELESKGVLSVEDLKNNDEFYDIILESLEIAMKNSRKEKLELLQNATINSIYHINEKDDLKFILLKTLDELTPTHVQVLRQFENIGENNVKEFENSGIKDKYGDYLSELVLTGLINHVPETNNLVLESHKEKAEYSITKKGLKFLDFIKNSETE